LFGCKNTNKNLTTYNITCSYAENKITGVEEITFYNDTELVFSQLKFNLFGNAFRKDAKYSPVSLSHKNQCYPNGVSYGDMQITSVTSKQRDLDYQIGGIDQNVLVVDLTEELFPNQTITLEIEFTTTLANVVHRTGINSKTVNLANFYPILCGIDENGFYECVYYANGDPFFSEVANYNVKFITDSNYVVAGAGELVDKIEQGNNCVYNYQLLNARSFTLVLSKLFNCLNNTANDVQINYYYYDDASPEKSMEYAVKSIRLFESLFGEYPFDTYTVVQTKFVQGGMEFSALSMISDNLEEKAYGEVIVHETAHQWWQAGVGNNEIEYGFLDEGLAEYSVVCFYENYPEYGFSRQALIKSSETTYKTYCTVSDKLFKNVDTSMIRSLKDFKSEYEYVNLAYVKPCIMYDYLRTSIGDQNFFDALKKYYKENVGKVVIPDDLISVFIKNKNDVEGFFNSFFDGKVII
jgi:hypothetical protein